MEINYFKRYLLFTYCEYEEGLAFEDLYSMSDDLEKLKNDFKKEFKNMVQNIADIYDMESRKMIYTIRKGSDWTNDADYLHEGDFLENVKIVE